jgi:hypothetical protein
MSHGLGKRRFLFSPLGVRLLAFWLLAMTLFLVGWKWRPAGLSNQSVQSAPPAAAAPAQVRKPKPTSDTLLEQLFVDRDDSWAAMRAALEQRRDHPDEPLYAGVLAQCLKFQYPPSSLLSIDAVGSLLGAAAVSNPVLNVLSLLFPPGERFFMDAVRAFRGQVKDPSLLAQVRGFLGQEALHSREHKVFNRWLNRFGLDAEEIEAAIAQESARWRSDRRAGCSGKCRKEERAAAARRWAWGRGARVSPEEEAEAGDWD